MLNIRKRVGIIRKYGNMRSGNTEIRKYEIRKSENMKIRNPKIRKFEIRKSEYPKIRVVFCAVVSWVLVWNSLTCKMASNDNELDEIELKDNEVCMFIVLLS